MGRVLPYRSPKAGEETTAFIGMVLFLGSWAMLFAAFLYSFGVLRSRAGVWPPPGMPEFPFGLLALNTLVIVASSAALVHGTRELRAGRGKSLGWWLVATFVLGSTFLALQYRAWAALVAGGVTPGTGPYGSIFYALTGVHALHVMVGLVAMLWLAARAARDEFTAGAHLPIRLWGMYWHFVGVVWVIMLAVMRAA